MFLSGPPLAVGDLTTCKICDLCKVPDDAGADGPVQEEEETRVWAFIERPLRSLDDPHR
jgi:hypothetical protein